MVVKMEPLIDLSEQLARLHGDLENESDEVARVFRSLQELSGMEQVCETLRRSQQTLEQQAWFARQQSKALEQVVRWYDDGERRIREAYEESAVRYPRGQSAAFNIAYVADYLK